jgi:hypothetical protein
MAPLTAKNINNPKPPLLTALKYFESFIAFIKASLFKLVFYTLACPAAISTFLQRAKSILYRLICL